MKRKKQTRYTRLALIIGIIALLIISLIGFNFVYNLFFGVGLQSSASNPVMLKGKDCGSISVGENGDSLHLVTMPGDTSLPKIKECLLQNFATCSPSYAEFTVPAIDSGETRHIMRVVSENGKCSIQDRVESGGGILGGQVQTTNLTCSIINPASVDLWLQCDANTSVQIDENSPSQQPTLIQQDTSSPQQITSSPQSQSSGFCTKANGCNNRTPGSGYRCDASGQVNITSGNHWCSCTTNCDVQIQ